MMRCLAVTFATFHLALSLATAKSPDSPLYFHWPREAALMGTGLVGHFVGQHRLAQMEPAAPEELRRADLAPWDRWSAGTWNPRADAFSDLAAWGIGGAMLYADLWHAARGTTSWQPFWEDFLILGQALAWNSAINLNVRAGRVHARPFAYGTKAPEADRRKGEAAGAFYSGHASAAFLGAVYVSTVYPLRHPEFEHRAWLWAGSLTAATAAATLRVAAGKHFPSDAIAGAAMGSLIAAGFIRLHREDAMWLGWRAVPWIDADGAAGVMAVRRL